MEGQIYIYVNDDMEVFLETKIFLKIHFDSEKCEKIHNFANGYVFI